MPVGVKECHGGLQLQNSVFVRLHMMARTLGDESFTLKRDETVIAQYPACSSLNKTPHLCRDVVMAEYALQHMNCVINIDMGPPNPVRPFL